MLFAARPRISMPGCSAAVSQCLTGGFVLSLSGCLHWKEAVGGGVGWGWGSGWALTTNSVNLAGALAVSVTLPPFPLASFLLCFIFLLSVLLPPSPHPSLLFWPCHLQNWILGQLGLIPDLACHSWPIRSSLRRSPDTVIEGEQRKQGENRSLKTKPCHSWLVGGVEGGSFCLLSEHMLCVSFISKHSMGLSLEIGEMYLTHLSLLLIMRWKPWQHTHYQCIQMANRD